ncbi:zinc-binding alcohol dehydrogenase [uncultured Sphaerochaeta sp.]|uniref:zinc-dependent alcohol dehydrogenase n=1 Tax=uncultured Sphaerochaeta sp. TaxID=886478 RepID=UPI002A0A7FC2|nr:zinc-binding alcohol dehydrogenase [uncultured Sphaerochaeta sp.]
MKRSRREVQFVEKYKAELVSVPIGELKESSIIVENVVSMISPGTELALFMGTHIGFSDPEIAWARYPLAAGYASVGRVVEKGNAVMKFEIGDMVMHYRPHADIALVDTKKDMCFLVDNEKAVEQALFTRFGQIAYTGVAVSKRKEGAVLVYGGGMIGNLCGQLYKNTTHRQVILADVSQSRLDFARSCNLEVLDNGSSDKIGELERLTGGKGVDTVVEATGIPALANEALKTVNEHGEVVFLGSTRGLVEIDVYKHIHRKFLDVYGAHENRYPMFGKPDSQESFAREVIQELQEGTLQTDRFITDHIQPSQIQQAYHWLIDDRDHHLGIIIQWKEAGNV